MNKIKFGALATIVCFCVNMAQAGDIKIASIQTQIKQQDSMQFVDLVNKIKAQQPPEQPSQSAIDNQVKSISPMLEHDAKAYTMTDDDKYQLGHDFRFPMHSQLTAGKVNNSPLRLSKKLHDFYVIGDDSFFNGMAESACKCIKNSTYDRFYYQY